MHCIAVHSISAYMMNIPVTKQQINAYATTIRSSLQATKHTYTITPAIPVRNQLNNPLSFCCLFFFHFLSYFILWYSHSFRIWSPYKRRHTIQRSLKYFQKICDSSMTLNQLAMRCVSCILYSFLALWLYVLRLFHC